MVSGSFKLKFIITGDPYVGKTSLRRTYLGKSFKSNYLPTISADFSSKIVKLDELRIDCGIWDIAGHQKHSKMVNSYFRNAHGAVIVCDITNPSSMSNIINWIDRILANNPQISEKNKLSLLIVANKVDLRSEEEEERQISRSEFIEFVDNLVNLYNQLLPIFDETSALTGYNVKNMLSRLIQMSINQVMKEIEFESPHFVNSQLTKWQFMEKYKEVEIVKCNTCGKKYQKPKDPPFNCEYCDTPVKEDMMEKIYLNENTILKS